MHRSIGLAVVLLSACGGSRTPATPPGHAAPQPPGTTAPPRDASSAGLPCAEQAARLGTQLRELAAAQPGFLPLVPGIKAPVTSAARPVDKRGIVVAVNRDSEMFAQGSKVSSTGELREYFQSVHSNAFEKTFLSGGTAADATV